MRTVMGFVVALSVLAIAATPHETNAGRAPAWSAYGGKVTLKKAVPLGALLQQKQHPANREVLTHVTVSEVCRSKGCWMTVNAGKDEVRVEFRDYGFFVPWGIEGKKARMQGVIEERVMSREEQEHIAAESKRPGEVSEQPKRLLVFVASAVEIEGGGPISSEQQDVIAGRGRKPPEEHTGHDHK